MFARMCLSVPLYVFTNSPRIPVEGRAPRLRTEVSVRVSVRWLLTRFTHPTCEAERALRPAGDLPHPTDGDTTYSCAPPIIWVRHKPRDRIKTPISQILEALFQACANRINGPTLAYPRVEDTRDIVAAMVQCWEDVAACWRVSGRTKHRAHLVGCRRRTT
jgi:hypothetical protein